jgi:hypothetical protein
MLTLTEIFAIIFIHWIADFVFQDEKWALGKSKNWSDLLAHTATYTLMWWSPIMVLLIFYSNTLPITGTQVFGFLGITFIAHTITDYFTSRIVSKKFANKHYGSAIPNFGAFTVIGIDQVLHYVQLFLTYYLLK